MLETKSGLARERLKALRESRRVGFRKADTVRHHPHFNILGADNGAQLYRRVVAIVDGP